MMARWVTRAWGRREESCLMEGEFQVYKKKKFQRWGHNHVKTPDTGGHLTVLYT